jgi:putative endopeptidase
MMRRAEADDEDEEFNKMEIKMSDDMPLNGSPSVTTTAGGHSILGDVPAFQKLSQQKRRQYTLAAMAAAAFLFVLVVVLIVGKNGDSGKSRGGAKDDTSTSDWNDYPASVRQMVDREVDPCHDFYQYACGKWLVNTDIPGDRTAILASFSTIHDQNELVLKAIMQENFPYLSELYGSCMNTTRIDAVGVEPLRGYLTKIANVKDRVELFRLAGELSKLGPDFLTGLGVQADAKDATVYMLYASQTGLSLPNPTYYSDTKRWSSLVGPYEEFITTVFTLAGFNASDAAANRKLIIDFEQQLAKLFVDKEELMDPLKTYNPVKLADAMASYPLLIGAYLNGTSILKTIAQNPKIPPGKAQASLVSVKTPTFFAQVEKLVAATPVTTLRVMLAYHLLRDVAPNLSEPFVAAAFEFFSKRINGQKQRSPRWKVCLQRVTKHFPRLLGKYFFIKKFDGESEMIAKTMVDNIEASMTTMLQDAPWLDSGTKHAALEKMKMIANLIGHSAQDEHFPFVLSEDAYWANLETVNQYTFNRSVSRIATTVDRGEWFMPASEVNAYYSAETNQIVFPAGILQAPFFDKKAHPSQNYGGIGAVIGHEITHGFDDSGRYFDGNGNLVDWWNDKTDNAFRERTKCLVDQYSNFQVVSALDETAVLGNVNGNFTVGENIADNGGVKVAFQALKRYLWDRDEAEELRETASLSREAAEKLYFLSFAQVFCAKATDESMVRRLNIDAHAPERWRVNGVMMNSQDFKRVYDCPAGSPMAPKDTCEVW